MTNDPLEHLASCIAAGRPVAIARVVAAWGSAPRPPGSLMTIDATGHVEGSLSGGCIEAEVEAQARRVLGGAPSRLLSFSVDTGTAHGAGLSCGGAIDILLEAVGPPAENVDDQNPGDRNPHAEGTGGWSPDLPAHLLSARAGRRPAMLLTRLGPDVPRTRLMEPDGGDAGFAGLPDGIARTVGRARATGASTRVADPDGSDWFIHALPPRPRLLIVGAVHIAQGLAPLALRCGFDVVVIDPRDGLATPARFPGITLSDAWPDEALEAMACDGDTAVVALTHQDALDDPALATALRGEAFYIGCLGSRRTQAQRRARLAAGGACDVERLRGPVGLAIGAVGAEEIAVAIMAEIIAVRRGGPLSRRQGW